jgi:hypothetical protein
VETVSRTDDIEAGCNLSFERRWWRIQRICWLVMSVLLVGAVAGVFGNGPLSRATAHPAGGRVEVHYARLARRETPALLELRLDKQAIASGQVRIRLNRELVHRLRIKDIIPAPVSTEPLADGARFTFPTDPTSDPAVVVFVQDTSTPGIVEGEVTVEGADPVRFRQFVYP